MYVSGDSEFDTPTVMFAAYAATSRGRRGAHGSLLPDRLMALALGESVRTVERNRAKMRDIGHCVVTPHGRRASKRVSKLPGEAFVIVPAIAVRALLTRQISCLAFKVYAQTINERIEPGRLAGCWRGVGWLARKLHRTEKAVADALAELVAAALLRVEDFGAGLPRRLEPQCARPVTQKLGRAVREAREWLHRRVGLRRPQLATPSPDVGSTPPSGVGYRPSPSGPHAQVRGDSHASRPVRDLSMGDLFPPGRVTYSEWQARRQSQVIRT